MKEVKGDLLKMALSGEFDVIAHGCNCFCVMGAGIALQIKRQFPKAAEADKRTVEGDEKKMGLCSVANQHNVWIVNAYTQFLPGMNVNYTAIRKCMKYIKVHFSGERIGLPLIGCGIAGGDWKKVKKIFEEELAGEDVTVVHYQ